MAQKSDHPHMRAELMPRKRADAAAGARAEPFVEERATHAFSAEADHIDLEQTGDGGVDDDVRGGLRDRRGGSSSAWRAPTRLREAGGRRCRTHAAGPPGSALAPPRGGSEPARG